MASPLEKPKLLHLKLSCNRGLFCSLLYLFMLSKGFIDKTLVVLREKSSDMHIAYAGQLVLTGWSSCTM